MAEGVAWEVGIAAHVKVIDPHLSCGCKGSIHSFLHEFRNRSDLGESFSGVEQTVTHHQVLGQFEFSFPITRHQVFSGNLKRPIRSGDTEEQHS